MALRIGIENNNEGYRTIAWAVEHPGCFAYGMDTESALSVMQKTVQDYTTWIASHEPPWLDAVQEALVVEDTWLDYNIDESYDRVEEGGYAVEPFFLYDWKPLTGSDIERGLKLLTWSRIDLLDTITRLDAERLARTYPNERWNIAGIIGHIGGAEWWYLDRMNLAFPRDQVPKEPLERLEKVRSVLIETLPRLEGSQQIVGVQGEFWSPRKILRRAVWHERDHTAHIRKLI